MTSGESNWSSFWNSVENSNESAPTINQLVNLWSAKTIYYAVNLHDLCITIYHSINFPPKTIIFSVNGRYCSGFPSAVI